MTASNHGNGLERTFNAKEERKLRKPLIEKRRRERINCSLEHLKGIMVDAYNLDQSKLEKADVLEITVQHMESLQRSNGHGSPATGISFESRQRYSSGYIQCMHEVHNLLLSCPGMDKTLGARLLNHLLKSLPHISTEGTGPGSAAAGTPGGVNGSVAGSNKLPASPAHSPLSLPSLKPHSSDLHTPPSPPPTPSPDSPHHCSRISLAREGVVAGAREQPSPTRPAPLPIPHANLALPALPRFFPGGDPSMWRPW